MNNKTYSIQREFANTIPKPFTARYCPYTCRIEQLDNKKLILKNMRQVGLLNINFKITKKDMKEIGMNMKLIK